MLIARVMYRKSTTSPTISHTIRIGVFNFLPSHLRCLISLGHVGADNIERVRRDEEEARRKEEVEEGRAMLAVRSLGIFPLSVGDI